MGSLRWHGPAARRHVDAALARRLDRIGEVAVTIARRLVPYDSGDLHDSIDHVVAGTPRGPVLILYAGMPYARFVEFGTSKMAAQPYLRPALHQVVATRGSLSAYVRFAQPGRPE
jgi:HK97 gp10 family phage protein